MSYYLNIKSGLLITVRKITEQKKAIFGLRLNSWKGKNPN